LVVNLNQYLGYLQLEFHMAAGMTLRIDLPNAAHHGVAEKKRFRVCQAVILLL